MNILRGTRYKLHQLFLLPLLLLLSACPTSPPIHIQDTADAIIAAKYGLEGINIAIGNMANTRQITSQQARKLALRADEVGRYLQDASTLVKVKDEQGALSKLKLAQTILMTLQREVEKKR